MIREAVILAGGMGTRLQSVVSDVPKPMAEVGGRPFLTYLLDQLILSGIDHIVLAVGYMSEIVKSYIGASYKGCNITYSVESTPLGTGGAIRMALQHCTTEDVVVMNGDSIFVTDLSAVYDTHVQSDCQATLVLALMRNFDRYGCVTFDEEGRVTSFEEKKQVDQGYINTGIYIIGREDFLRLSMPDRFSIERDYFEQYIDRHHFKVYSAEGYFIDIGIPEDYTRADQELPSISLV